MPWQQVSLYNVPAYHSTLYMRGFVSIFVVFPVFYP